MKKIIFLLILLSHHAFGQQKILFTPEAFINGVKQYHPVAKQASIQVEKANADLLSAKGSFDPTVALDMSRKTFDGKNYYYYNNPELKVPLPIGDIKTGIENNGGTYINTELTPGNTSYLGFELPVLKNFLIDKRRAALQQANILQKQSNQERLKILNQLFFEAYVAYWQWAGSYQLFNTYNRFLEISNERLRLVKIAAANGDRSIMDTLEAFTQVQNIELQRADALIKLNEAALDLSNFLWNEKDSAYLIPENYVPDTLQFSINPTPVSLNEVINQALSENPSLRSYDFKLQTLEVERKLKFQSLLPSLNLKANLLNRDYNVLKGFNGALLENNYKWGIDFKVPIFLREGRGEYRKTKLKIQETSLEQNYKRWEIQNKIRTYFNEFEILQRQLQTVVSAFANYNSLLRNETLKFNNGESSLFLINSRENKVLEITEKNIQLRIKYFKSRYAVDWAAGILR